LQTADDANGQGGVAKEELNKVKAMRDGTVVLNVTSKTEKEEDPDHEIPVSEIDAHYGCGSDEHEVRDLQPEASVARSAALLTAADAHNPFCIAKDARNADEVTMRGTPCRVE
jgi:hypothetical protein